MATRIRLSNDAIFTVLDCMYTMKDLMKKDPSKYVVTSDEAFENVMRRLDKAAQEMDLDWVEEKK